MYTLYFVEKARDRNILNSIYNYLGNGKYRDMRFWVSN